MLEGNSSDSIVAYRSREWVIRPRRSGLLNLLRDLWDYRALFGFVAARSILQLYRRAILGVAWLVIRPVITVIAAVFVVGKVLGISTAPVPLVLFIVAGLSLWTLFKAGLRHGTRALTRGRGLIRRVNFPRIMVVLGALAPALIEFAVVFAGAFLVFGYFAYTEAFTPVADWPVFAVIPVLLLAMVLVVAVSCVTSVLNNIASDTALSLNYAMSIVFVASPAVYPLAAVPEDWRWVMLLNPLAPAMEIWRWALLGTPYPPLWSVATAVALTTVLLIGGLMFFLRWEQTILDRS